MEKVIRTSTEVRTRRTRSGTTAERLRQCLMFAAVFAGTSGAGAAAAQEPKRDRYLEQYTDVASLQFPLPPKPPGPKDGDSGIVDLDQVRAAQFVDQSAKAEAFADAEAYGFEALLPRFSVAAGRSLDIRRRPILAHMLRWILQDAGAYGHIKDGPARQRPFTEDGTIVPCDVSYLMKTVSPAEAYTLSYPSGHATNGYLAGMLMAKVMPDRATAVMARGVRYGTNRIVCGVHYPTDVAAGQLFARFLFAKIEADAQFRIDLTCALEEDQLDRIGKLPRRSTGVSTFSATCAPLDQAYYGETTPS